MIRIGVIGYGYWGPNLVRNFAETPGSQVIAVCDAHSERLEQVRPRYPGVEITTDYRDLLVDSRIDAIAITTPVSTHFTLAMEALRAGKHVLVEKPMTSTSEQAMRLIDEADRQKLTLMVDHTFVYTGAIQKIRDMVANDFLGDIYYYDSVRINLGLFHHEVSVIWDLAVHDLSILNYVFPAKPCAVSVTGLGHIAGQLENIAYLTLFFDDNLIAHIHVNWLAPVKIRRTIIGGSRKMIVYDDLEPSEKIKVYDKGITLNNDRESVYQTRIGYRTGDMWAPQLDTTEALRAETLHFIRCIERGEPPMTGGEAGLQVVRILEVSAISMAERGRLIEVEAKGLTA